jgi:hypothetical protein
MVETIHREPAPKGTLEGRNREGEYNSVFVEEDRVGMGERCGK